MQIDFIMNTTNGHYDSFKAEWLKEVLKNTPTSVDKGRRFARKILKDWIDFNEEADEIIFCDGAGDGGLDAVYYQPGDKYEENANDGDTWYLVQSKYGYAYQGEKTLIEETQKIINSIEGLNPRLSNLSEDIITRLNDFRTKAKDDDKMVLVFATTDPLSEEELDVLNKIKEYGQKVLGSLFEVEKVSLRTIFDGLQEKARQTEKIKVPISANLVQSGEDLLVGSVKLKNVFHFLNHYDRTAGSIELIYDKNVRKFLGGKGAVNRKISSTINNEPHRFGLYNNGITIVVEEFKIIESDKFELTNPYIVNGCQTTKTIWNELKKKNYKEKPSTEELSDWENLLNKGILVVKIVKVGSDGEALLVNTTKYTNFQNSVSQKDFIALEKNFKHWQAEMEQQYNIYLEIQRGGWESVKAQNQKTFDGKEYKDHVNAFDLLKIYGAGWMEEPGFAFSKNVAFAPNGSVFNNIMKIETFGVNDLYAAYLLLSLTEKYQFGRKSEETSRRMTRYLFCFLIINILKKVMVYSGIERTHLNITNAVLKIFEDDTSEAAQNLINSGLNIIKTYFVKDEDTSIHKEPNFYGDISGFLKGEKIGKNEDYSPKLIELIHSEFQFIKRSHRGETPQIDAIAEVIKSNFVDIKD